jgi:alginate O-acetyltransferase complex protein AlgI
MRDFLLYKGFWPQLIAGPIIRPGEIREQIEGDRTLDYESLSIGCRRILIGFFKKIVLADTLAQFVDMVYMPGAAPNAIDSAVGTLAFGLQIYFDFSAYSDIAIGTSRLFGFIFPENFDWPYLSRSPQEFWSRWHMTLSRWIRDYVFTPMTFAARHRPKMALLWILMAMAVCGFWHGAQWSFIIWGTWHGIILVLNQTLLKNFFPAPGDSSNGWNTLKMWLGMVVTFGMVTVGWVFFRAATIHNAWEILSSILLFKGGLQRAILRENAILVVLAIFFGLVTIQLMKVRSPRWDYLSPRLDPVKRFIKPVAYAFLILAVIIFDESAKAFVYFQF